MHNCYKLYGSLLRHFSLKLYVVKGIFDGEKLSMLVADDGSTLDYITKTVFPNGASIAKNGRIHALKAPGLVNSRFDMVVVGANRLLMDRYVRNGFRIIPKWVRLTLPVVKDPYARLSAFGRRTRSYFNRKLHKLEAANFECEVVAGKEWFAKFYQEMYRPYILSRFEGDAVIYGRKVLEKYYKRGFLIIAKQNGKPVAGEIVYQKGDVLYTPFIGICGGDVELVKEGVTFALHYYLAQKAYEWGGAYIDFGVSRPFLSDGTLSYKLNWHMNVELFDAVTDVFAVATPNNTPQAMKFLETNPHFYLSGGKCVKSDEEERTED